MCETHALSRQPGDGLVVADVRAADGAGPMALAELEAALADHRIQAHFQPIVGVRDGRPVAMEVLARLVDPGRGMVLPDLFVPQLEAAGLAPALTALVVQSAFAEWQAADLTSLDLMLAVNVPLDVLLMPASLSLLDGQRARAGLPTGQVIVELTESRPLCRLDELAAAVAGLRQAGYRVAIDDVGPGLRDPGALLALDFSVLKLDKGFVQRAMDDPRTADCLHRTVADARAAGMAVVAEGVATAEGWAHVAALGIDLAQGYFVAQPMAAGCVRDWHRHWTARHQEAAGA